VAAGVRHVVVGAGAIGGTIAGRLAAAGHEVVAVARGAHGAAICADGLRLVTPDDVVVQRVPVVEAVSALAVRDDDVVYLAVKSQHTAGVLDELAERGEPAIVCAQNGVANERAALRRFARVIGMCVMMPVTYTTPGVVEIASNPVNGVLDVGPGHLVGGAAVEVGDHGRAPPHGPCDVLMIAIAAALESTGRFESRVVANLMRWKYGKLLFNLGNALEAVTGRLRTDEGQALVARARAEGRAALAAAGIPAASDDEMMALGARIRAREIDGKPRPGGSSWQSLARGCGSIEADYLNGEIVLLGRLHGVATPVNERLRQVANAQARAAARPGALTVAEVAAGV
jgi:2-dehydropantoate 2-reductase